MTYLSHIIVFAGDLINLRCVFKSSVSSRSCHKPYISVLFWANEAILLYQLSETKPKQRKMLQAQVKKLMIQNVAASGFHMHKHDSAGHQSHVE